MVLFRTIDYDPDKNTITILDQTKLPGSENYVTLGSTQDLIDAIKNMNLRGAPLIGVAAAYGAVQAAKTGSRERARQACDLIGSARPTAVNLSWAVSRMLRRIDKAQDLFAELLDEARAIEKEDKDACARIGANGAALIKDNCVVMVHCNAGALATSGIGTALGIIYTAADQGKKVTVYSCETRPLLQGARLTSWELTRSGIETHAVCDNMAAAFMNRMDIVLVGADRVARNGDVANKIGTRSLAIIARYHSVPFYVAAPMSTFDPDTLLGSTIPIEQRNEDELRMFNGLAIVAAEAEIHNPAFDITPADLISGIVNEHGILRPPFEETVPGSFQ